MHEGISYMDDIDVYYFHCHTDGSEFSFLEKKWYKITCILKLPGLPIHKNIYFIPHPRLDEFLKYNPEKLIDIESIDVKDAIEFINTHKKL